MERGAGGDGIAGCHEAGRPCDSAGRKLLWSGIVEKNGQKFWDLQVRMAPWFAFCSPCLLLSSVPPARGIGEAGPEGKGFTTAGQNLRQRHHHRGRRERRGRSKAFTAKYAKYATAGQNLRQRHHHRGRRERRGRSKAFTAKYAKYATAGQNLRQSHHHRGRRERRGRSKAFTAEYATHAQANGRGDWFAGVPTSLLGTWARWGRG
jgi:hypothetical protein